MPFSLSLLAFLLLHHLIIPTSSSLAPSTISPQSWSLSKKPINDVVSFAATAKGQWLLQQPPPSLHFLRESPHHMAPGSPPSPLTSSPVPPRGLAAPPSTAAAALFGWNHGQQNRGKCIYGFMLENWFPVQNSELILDTFLNVCFHFLKLVLTKIILTNLISLKVNFVYGHPNTQSVPFGHLFRQNLDIVP